MAVVRIHRYAVEPDRTEELILRRAELIMAIRVAYPGLTEVRLTRLDDGTFADAWRWDSVAQMQAAFPAMATFPEASAAMALTQDSTAQNGEIVDER